MQFFKVIAKNKWLQKLGEGGRTPFNPPLENVFKLNNIFSKLGRHLKEIFRKFRNNDKLKRVIIHVVLQLPVVLVNFTKSDGNRFSNHKYVKAMILIISLNFSMVKRHRLQEVKQRQLTKASLKLVLVLVPYLHLDSMHFQILFFFYQNTKPFMPVIRSSHVHF